MVKIDKEEQKVRADVIKSLSPQGVEDSLKDELAISSENVEFLKKKIDAIVKTLAKFE